jgi:hypothetical protein
MPHAMLRRAVTLFVIQATSACTGQTDNSPLPPDARPFTPEPIYLTWWMQMETCSGLSADFTGVGWYVVPGEDPFIAPALGRTVLGYWQRAGNRIVLLEFVPSRTALVRHEMLHALLQRGDHPAAYFIDRCGAVIDGPGLLPD